MKILNLSLLCFETGEIINVSEIYVYRQCRYIFMHSQNIHTPLNRTIFL